jgi:hypothetical protein
MDFWEEIYSNLREAIFSMSEHLRTIEIQLVSKRNVIIEHLIKLYYFRDSQWAGVWKRSVFSAVSSVPSWKRHKFPAWDFIYSRLWKGIEDVWDAQFGNRLDVVAGRLNGGGLDVEVMLENPRPVDIGYLVQNYCYWLSHALEAKGQVSSVEVCEVIDDLLDRYIFVPPEKS